MATLNEKKGSIIAHCPGCDGGKSTFEWKDNSGQFGAIEQHEDYHTYGLRRERHNASYRLFRCAGCGAGAFAKVLYDGSDYPGTYSRLIYFYPEAKEPLKLPASIPDGIKKEFKEAEKCLGHGCYRAASGLFRSVLEKVMKANGYKVSNLKNLEMKIDAVAKDGVITESRKKKAHEDIRVLGNDVLHDDYREILEEEVEKARHYCQRILEDFYDDRESVLTLLRNARRTPEEDRQEGQ